MRIISVNIPSSCLSNGLLPLQMARLQNIVLLAGKNGSGKSRLLSSIRETVSKKPTKEIFASSTEALKDLYPRRDLEKARLEAKIARVDQTASGSARKRLEQEIELNKANLQNIADQIVHHEQLTSWEMVEYDDHYSSYPIINFVPKSTSLDDFRLRNTKSLREFADSVAVAGVGSLAQGTIPKIQQVQDRWFDATHPLSSTLSPSKDCAIEEYSRLQQILHNHLGEKLGRSSDGHATLFGLPLEEAHLSEGQTIILQLCVAIFSQSKSLDDAILFLDEPENHLHPGVLIDFLIQLEQKMKNGQIWIATHSVPLLAAFDPSCIWYVQSGKVSFAGNAPQAVLEDLLGNDEQRARLRDFIDLPSIHALYHHAYECLIEPSAVNTGFHDPQTAQIRHQLNTLRKEGGVLKILDFGAGRGRLIANIVQAALSDEQMEKISYFAFDPSKEHADECTTNIAKYHPDSRKRYFNDLHKLLNYENESSFDVVIMANVLHEIEPSKWLSLFGPAGSISRLLQPKGVVLIVEDQLMPIGEKAYQKGFIVLDTPELKQLFRITEKDKGFSFIESRAGRLKAHVIPKSSLMRVTAQSRVAALQSIHNIAQTRVVELRNAEVTYVNGKKHGFWIQQLANSQLCLSELSNKNS